MIQFLGQYMRLSRIYLDQKRSPINYWAGTHSSRRLSHPRPKTLLAIFKQADRHLNTAALLNIAKAYADQERNFEIEATRPES